MPLEKIAISINEFNRFISKTDIENKDIPKCKIDELSPKPTTKGFLHLEIYEDGRFYAKDEQDKWKLNYNFFDVFGEPDDWDEFKSSFNRLTVLE